MAAEGLRFHYDVAGAEPIIRDIRVYSASTDLDLGTCMVSGPVATGENGGAAIRAVGGVLSNVIGVLNEDVTAANALGVVATGVDFFAKVIINPFAVWLGKYSFHADDDEVTTTTTPKVLTQTMVTDHFRTWAYVTNTGSSTGGFGNLWQTGAVSTTASITAATDFDDNLTDTLANTDTFIVMHAPYSADVAGGSVDLSVATSGTSINAMQIAAHETTAAAGAAIVLENFISSRHRPLERLVTSKHSGFNYSDEDPSFYGDIMFSEHVLIAGGTPNTRVIT